MTDKILISNLRLQANHGVLPEETRLGQKFELDIECSLDTRPFASSDTYEDAVCYGAVSQIAEDISSKQPYKLLEKLGHEIAIAILSRFEAVTQVQITIRKPSAPVPQMVDYLGVALVRTRADLANIS